MKNLATIFTLLLVCQFVSAQNTFPSYGNAGIGTTSPSTSLTITPGVIGPKISLFDGAPGNFYGFGISNNQLNYHVYTNIDNHVFFSGGKNGDGVELMRIKGNGNVGIGTTQPQEKLSVNGKIRSKEVKVENNNWPDYVFDSSYQLPTLQQTESFIKANGHLPEIPSAKQVEKEGVDLGSNQALLLKKIEELTLHIIEINKKLEKLEAENKDFQKSIKK